MTEQEQLASTEGPGAPGHPELEELAALADGLLAPAEAERLWVHLDACERCFEVFTETLHLVEALGPDQVEEPTGNVLPWRPRSRWMPATAAALLAVSVGGVLLYDHFRTPMTDLSVATLARPIATKNKDKTVSEIAWKGPTMRGGETKTDEPPPEARAVQLGAALFNLQLALASNDPTAAADAVPSVRSILGFTGAKDQNGDPVSSVFLDASLRQFYSTLDGRLKAADLGGVAAEAARQAEALRASDYFKEDRPYFNLGAWTAAGYSAAASNKPFAQKSAARHVLGTLQTYKKKEPKADLPLQVVAALESIGRLPTDDVRAAKPDFEKILHYYYTRRSGL